MRSFFRAIAYAMRDYSHEALLSACAVLGLAAVLAPLLVLLGVQHGVISAMTERLLKDPRTLEAIPVGSGKYGPEWFRELSSLSEVAFVLPQTRSIAATVYLRNPQQSAMTRSVCPIIATAEGDPLPGRWQQPQIVWKNALSPQLDRDSAVAAHTPDGRPSPTAAEAIPLRAGVILSDSIAVKLNSRPGDILTLTVERVRSGKRESNGLSVEVLSILPPEAYATDVMFVPLELLVATEDYRDGREVRFLGWPGEADESSAVYPAGTVPHALLSGYSKQIREQREYSSFRLYAKTLDDVQPLWHWLRDRNVEVYVKSDEIEYIKSLDTAFTVVFSLITGAALFGFTASTASSALAGVRRKSRSLGIMRLMGFSRSGILFFPIAQSLATALFGAILAYGLYLAVAFSIDSLFASSLPGGEAICSLPPSYLAAALGAVLALSALSSLAAAWQATKIEPSEVIRDV